MIVVLISLVKIHKSLNQFPGIAINKGNMILYICLLFSITFTAVFHAFKHKITKQWPYIVANFISNCLIAYIIGSMAYYTPGKSQAIQLTKMNDDPEQRSDLVAPIPP